MIRKVKIAIIGAGTAGLSAYKEAKKYTNDILVIDNGPLGSTCARIGCMPSKLLLQAANFFYNRSYFTAHGIYGSEHIFVKIPEVLNYVREMRDKFTSHVVAFTQSLDKHFLCGNAKFIDINKLQVNDETVLADRIIIATGAKSVLPEQWSNDARILTYENIFEQMTLASEIEVIGVGSIGLELAQAFSRLGIKIAAFNADKWIGGLSDPKVNDKALEIFQKEFSIQLNEKVSLTKGQNKLYINASNKKAIEQVVFAIGIQPNLTSLGLKKLGMAFDNREIPLFDPTTLQVQDYPIFIAGDVNKMRPLLHEAADEGRIAAYNALNKIKCFKRRTPLRIIFTEPNIVVAGKAYNECLEAEIAIGEVDFANQGRAKIMHQNQGLLRIYGSKSDGTLLGAEMIAPGGEHLGHLLAWSIEQKLTVFELLKMPYYHPVLEEGMRTALRNLSKLIKTQASQFDLAMCESEALHSLA